MVYTDGIHIVADSLVELHCFAHRAGIRRCWFDSNPAHPHYDKPKHKATQLLFALGAEFAPPKKVAMVARECK